MRTCRRRSPPATATPTRTIRASGRVTPSSKLSKIACRRTRSWGRGCIATRLGGTVAPTGSSGSRRLDSSSSISSGRCWTKRPAPSRANLRRPGRKKSERPWRSSSSTAVATSPGARRRCANSWISPVLRRPKARPGEPASRASPDRARAPCSLMSFAISRPTAGSSCWPTPPEAHRAAPRSTQCCAAGSANWRTTSGSRARCRRRHHRMTWTPRSSLCFAGPPGRPAWSSCSTRWIRSSPRRGVNT